MNAFVFARKGHSVGRCLYQGPLQRAHRFASEYEAAHARKTVVKYWLEGVGYVESVARR